MYEGGGEYLELADASVECDTERRIEDGANQRSMRARDRARAPDETVCPYARARRGATGRRHRRRRGERSGAAGRANAREGRVREDAARMGIRCSFKFRKELYRGAEGVDEGVDVGGDVVKVEAGPRAPGDAEVAMKRLRAVVTASAGDAGLI